eukprot:6213139-Alexandrium_andersonii.AAC.1
MVRRRGRQDADGLELLLVVLPALSGVQQVRAHAAHQVPPLGGPPEHAGAQQRIRWNGIAARSSPGGCG